MKITKLNKDITISKNVQKSAIIGAGAGAAIQAGWGAMILKNAKPERKDIFLKNMEGKINPDRAIELYDEAAGAYKVMKKAAVGKFFEMAAIGLAIGAGVAFIADRIKNAINKK